MNVYIFGGVGTKYKHVSHLIKLYKSMNLNPYFFEAPGLLSSGLFRPKEIDKFSNIYAKLFKDKNKPFIIHSISGSNWLTYDINKKIKANGIIFEAGPISPTIDTLHKYFIFVYNVNIPYFFLEIFMNILNIPKEDKYWYNRGKNIKPIKNTLTLIGNQDILIDKNKIYNSFINMNMNKDITKSININQNNNKLYIFKDTQHSNIYKKNTNNYIKFIKEWFNNII